MDAAAKQGRTCGVPSDTAPPTHGMPLLLLLLLLLLFAAGAGLQALLDHLTP
jgi:hypothetical protein